MEARKVNRGWTMISVISDKDLSLECADKAAHSKEGLQDYILLFL